MRRHEAAQVYLLGGNNISRGLALFDDELTNISYGHRWAIDSFRSLNFSEDKPQMKRAVNVCKASKTDDVTPIDIFTPIRYIEYVPVGASPVQLRYF